MSGMNNRTVSVVVATRNRPYGLASLLASLQCQTLLQFEVILALNGAESWHPHLDKVALALKGRGIQTHVHTCLGYTFAELHQHLIDSSTSEYVCRVDDDHILEPSYLEALLSALESNPDAGAAGGVVLHPDVPGFDLTPPEFMTLLDEGKRKGIMQTMLQLKRHPTDALLTVPDLYSTFMARKAAITSVGGTARCYNLCSYREETDLTLRMSVAGFRQMIVPKAIVWHVRADHGGERMSNQEWEEQRMVNEHIFRQRVAEWCGDPIQYFSQQWEQSILQARKRNQETTIDPSSSSE